MNKYQKLILQQNRQMVQYGVPDLQDLLAKQPTEAEYRHSLSADLYARIERCCEGNAKKEWRCKNAICPRCSLIQRTNLVESACDLQFEERLRAAFFTYAPTALSVGQGTLNQYPLGDQVDDLLAAFSKAWKGCPNTIAVVGSPDISLNEDPANLDEDLTAAERKKRHSFQIHFHLVLLSVDPFKLAEELKAQLLDGREPNQGEFHVQKCHCTGRTILYATKIKPIRRAAERDRRGNADRKVRPLARKPMAEALNWLSSAPINKRVFTYYQPGRTS